MAGRVAAVIVAAKVEVPEGSATSRGTDGVGADARAGRMASSTPLGVPTFFNVGTPVKEAEGHARFLAMFGGRQGPQ
jgi:hypothetical protein